MAGSNDPLAISPRASAAFWSASLAFWSASTRGSGVEAMPRTQPPAPVTRPPVREWVGASAGVEMDASLFFRG